MSGISENTFIELNDELLLRERKRGGREAVDERREATIDEERGAPRRSTKRERGATR